MSWRVIVGTLSLVITMILLGYVAVTEQDRMANFGTAYVLTNGKRLTEIGWSGTVHDYLLATVSGGRPRPSVQFSQYPQRMPTWSQDYGGPLRNDQIQYIVAFIMNWGLALANVTPE